MKIAFLCASLEPGRDGVGDYTRRLAAACAEFGYECLLLGLHDRHIAEPVREDAGPRCTVVRWPARLGWAGRIASIEDELASFRPDRVSWQFVSYGFHPKGIVGREIVALAERVSRYRSHVMLHEIWIGVARGDSYWKRFVGWRQRRALLAFLQAAKPSPLQTSNPSYATALEQQGWPASQLPLFSNIPVVPARVEERTAAIARHLPDELRGDGRMIAATFGTLHPQWRPEPAGKWLQAAAARKGRRPVLLAIGRTGSHGPRILQQLARTGLPVVTTGELAPAQVSCLLQASDLGIAPHPWELTGKSGVVAAMLDHGLPILLPRDDWRLRNGPTRAAPADPRIARLSDLDETSTDAWLNRRHSPGDSFPAAVSTFLHQLTA